MGIPTITGDLLMEWAGRAAHLAAIGALAVLARWAVRRSVRAAFSRMANRYSDSANAARLTTLGGLVCSAAGYGIFFVALLMVLTELGLDTKAALTTAGVLGLAVGLGSQRFVRDVIGGFFILLENQFAVGERVTLGGAAVTGTVLEMGLRVTKLRDDTGRLLFIGNGDITVVTNHSRGPLTVAVDVTLPVDADLDRTRILVAEAASTLPGEQWEMSPSLLGLVEPPEGKLRIRVAGKAAGDRDAAEMALRAALHDAFAKAGIQA